MCGRFTLTRPADDYAGFFEAEESDVTARRPSYNVAPTDEILAVAEHEGRRRLGLVRWGLVPHWAPDRRGAARLINARAETLLDRPSFRPSFVHKRCLIPADGFYEWERLDDGARLAHYFHPSDGRPLGFAGLWASWRDPLSNEWLRTVAIITTAPNAVVRNIHNRMPAVLDRSDWEAWLDRTNRDVEALGALLAPAPDGLLTGYPVSSIVNDVRNNVPECIVPLPAPPHDTHGEH